MEPEGISVAAIVPVLNEEAAVGDVVSGLLARGIKPVIVVDNGSTDNSSAVARTAGANVVYEPKRGYGSACWTGLQNLPSACDWVLFCAGDGQDDLSELPQLLQATGNASLVIGNRMGTAGGKETLTVPQQWASWIGGLVIWMGWGHYFADIGGMRVVSRDGIERMELKDRGFGFFVEMQVRALVLGLKVAEVPISYRPRVTGTPKISGTIKGTLKAAVILVYTVVRLYLSEVWDILTVPPSMANQPLIDTSTDTQMQTSNPDSASSWLDPISDMEAGTTKPQGTFGARKTIIPLDTAAVGNRQHYPGFPILSEGSTTSDGGASMSQEKLSSGPVQKLSLAARETKMWERRQSTRAFICIVIASVFIVYGSVMTALYNDPKEENGGPLFTLGCIMISSGYFLVQILPAMPTKWFWAVIVLSRLSGLMAEPSPGDDIYRFVWEGWIQLHGFNPYVLAPNSSELRAIQQTSHYMRRVYMGINHPDTPSVYPPMAQLLFRFFASIANRAMYFKAFFVAADIATCWLLQCHFGNRRAALFGWNPLVVLSSAAGGHFDPWMILPLVVAWFSCERGRYLLSAFFVGLSVAFKWVTAPFLPFLIVAFCEWRFWLAGLVKKQDLDATINAQGWKLLRICLITSLAIAGVGAVPLVVSAMPFCSRSFCKLFAINSKWAIHTRISDFLPRIIYYIVPSSAELDNKWFVMAVIPLLAVVYWKEAGKPQKQRISRFCVFGEVYFLMLWLFSPIVHFWYFTWGLPFVCQTNNLGTRLMSASALFSLLRYGATHNRNLVWYEWLLMWGPFILGWVISRLKRGQSMGKHREGIGIGAIWDGDKTKTRGKGA